MWFVLVFVVMPFMNGEETTKPVHLLYEPTFESAEQCVLWANQYPHFIAYSVLNNYPDSTGHQGIYCIEQDQLEDAIEKGKIFQPKPPGVSL